MARPGCFWPADPIGRLPEARRALGGILPEKGWGWPRRRARIPPTVHAVERRSLRYLCHGEAGNEGGDAAMKRSGVLARLRRLASDEERGSILILAAIILPIIMTMVAGGVVAYTLLNGQREIQ